jgi:hypothetical protein
MQPPRSASVMMLGATLITVAFSDATTVGEDAVSATMTMTDPSGALQGVEPLVPAGTLNPVTRDQRFTLSLSRCADDRRCAGQLLRERPGRVSSPRSRKRKRPNRELTSFCSSRAIPPGSSDHLSEV